MFATFALNFISLSILPQKWGVVSPQPPGPRGAVFSNDEFAR